mgnify:CR=1 FL=1
MGADRAVFLCGSLSMNRTDAAQNDWHVRPHDWISRNFKRRLLVNRTVSVCDDCHFGAQSEQTVFCDIHQSEHTHIGRSWPDRAVCIG